MFLMPGPPSGAILQGEDSRIAAARVLFEACGVLLARDAGQIETLEMPNLFALRKKIRAGAEATEVLRSAGLAWSTDTVLPWSHWITPGVETQRIFIAEMPPGMLPTFAKDEQVEATWLRPAQAQTHELAPAIVRTCWELARHDRIADVFADARARAEEPHPIVPRLHARSHCLLLPWDRDYETAGQGESMPLSFAPKWATGPSRFVLEGRTWKHVAAPGSTTED
jgi:hypothetical protein